MPEIWKNIVLGVIQGVTEWLPISSSGHLIVVEYIIGFRQDLAYDVFLHIGSLLVMLVYFRRDIFGLFTSFARRDQKNEHRMIGYVLVATACTVLIALLLEPVEPMLRMPLWLAAGFGFNALVLVCTKQGSGERSLTWGSAAFLGLLQGIAAVPAITRSGVTIGGALLMGIRREEAFRFSFLIAIPSILGAIVFKTRELVWDPAYLAGLAATVLVGYALLWLLEKIVMRDRLHLFWIYNAVLAIVILYA